MNFRGARGIAEGDLNEAMSLMPTIDSPCPVLIKAARVPTPYFRREIGAPITREQNGNNYCRTPSKTVLQDIGKASSLDETTT